MEVRVKERQLAQPSLNLQHLQLPTAGIDDGNHVGKEEGASDGGGHCNQGQCLASKPLSVQKVVGILPLIKQGADRPCNSEDRGASHGNHSLYVGVAGQLQGTANRLRIGGKVNLVKDKIFNIADGKGIQNGAGIPHLLQHGIHNHHVPLTKILGIQAQTR